MMKLTNQLPSCHFMMDEILNHLYKIGGLRIPSRTSSMRYKGVTDKTIGEMGQELGVAHALEGSVRKYGDTVRIIASLVNVATDDQIWSLSFKEEYRDIFAIQSTIAQKIAEELKAHISVEVKQRIEAIPTENTEAYNLYLQARYYLTETMELEKAKVLLDEAIHLDDKFAEAHALLGYYWLFRGSWLGDLQPEQLIHEALPLLNKARELNEDYPITYAFLSQVHLWYRWDFEDAGKAWDMFFQLSPSKQAMNSSYCDFLNASGRSEEAAAIVDKAVSSDPSYSSWGSGLSYYFNNQPYRAIQHYETAMKLFPSNDGLRNGLGRVYIYTGKYQEAINLIEAYVNKGNLYPRPLGNLAIAYFHTGQQMKADSILNDIKARSAKSPVGSPAFYTAMIYAQMNEADLAFEWLEKAYQDREVEMYWLKVEPPFGPLKNDPRWQEMLDKVGFPE
jgi:TolB-like protein/thioredoxin-like negative regulator of GroEL